LRRGGVEELRRGGVEYEKTPVTFGDRGFFILNSSSPQLLLS